MLQKYFGYASFRHNQEAIINSVLAGNDTFVLMPTGGGKSLCYQVPALLFDGITLVISPLIALMKDQVDALRLNGVEAAFINSSLTSQQQNYIEQRLKNNAIKLLYLAPERLMGTEHNSPFIKKLANLKISLIAVDEAHCISHWGHDFRPEYRMLSQLKEKWPDVPQIALTATADKRTRTDIVEKLLMKNPQVFVSSFNRPNIRYIVEPKFNATNRVIGFLKDHEKESGIIYCLSRKSTEALAEDLQQAGYKALAYHAGMETAQRNRHQELFLRDEVRIIVATIAFGMGIDKSNVRFVIHMDVPKNIEGYYQETGRAGRDGLESIALLLYAPGDVARLRKFAIVENNPEQTQIAQEKLDEITRFAEIRQCRRQFLLNYFDETSASYCGNCDVCLTRSEQFDATEDARKIFLAVRELKEKFGVRYVVDLVWGAAGSKIQTEHKQLSSYASGNARSRSQWNSIIAQLIGLGYLFKTSGLYPVLKLSKRGLLALQSGEKISLLKNTSVEEPLKLSEDLSAYAQELLTQLKELRKKIAQAENVPGYLVLSDTSLTELATYLPATLDDLQNIYGFGEIKIKRYGKSFLELVNRHREELQLNSLMHLKTPKMARGERVERDSATKQLTLRMFNEGNSVQQIARLRGLSLSTIESHMAFYILVGKVELGRLIDAAKAKAIRETVENLGSSELTPVKLALGAGYSFTEIRYVIADLENKKLQEPEILYRPSGDSQTLHEPVVEYLIRAA